MGLRECPPVLPEGQRRIIDAALRRFEKLKPAYSQLYRANRAWHAVRAKDSTIQAGQVRLIDWYRGAYAEEQTLRQDSNAKQEAWRSKARHRGWLVALEAAGLALAGYVLVAR